MISSLRTSLLVSCLIGCTSSVQAQAVASSVFGLRPSTSRSQRVVGLGDSKSQVVQVLGPPTKTSRFYDEIDRTWATVVHYGANKLTFVKDRLGLVELNDARMTVGRPGTQGFRVGAVLPKAVPGKMPLAFGNFKVQYKPGTRYNFAYSASSEGNMKSADGQVLDVQYDILYDQQGRVAHIILDETYD